MFPVISTLLKFVSEDYRRTPALRCIVPLMIGIAISKYIGFDLYVVALVIALITIGLMLVALRKRKYRSGTWNVICEMLLILAIAIFGISYSQLRAGDILTYHGKAHIDGYVCSILKSNDFSTHTIVKADTITTDSAKIINTTGYIKIYDQDINIEPGKHIAADVWIKQVKDDELSLIDEQTWMNEHNFQFVASTDSITPLNGTINTLQTRIWQLRLNVRQRLTESGMTNENINIMMALLMGDRSQLSNATKQQFSDCGIIHILAVSGMHVALIYGIISVLLSAVRRRSQTVACLLVLSILWFYAIICGMSPSVFRAVIMMSILEIGRLIGRTPNINNTLCIAAIIILIVKPTDIYNLGFWLSFMAVWGLANFGHCFDGHNPFHSSFIGRYVYGSGTMSLVAQIATAPVSLLAFHRFPIYFLIHNILLIWLIAPMICLTLIAVADGGIIQFGLVADLVISGFLHYIEWVSKWPCAVIENIPFNFAQCLLASLTLYALSWAISNKWFSWQISKVWLTVGMCTIAFIALCIACNIVNMQRNAIIVYSAGREVGVSIISGQECTHILTDTTNIRLIRRAHSVEQKTLTKTTKQQLMYEGMIISTPTDTLQIINDDNNNIQPTKITLVTGTALPNNNNYQHVIVAPHTPFATEWKNSTTQQFDNMQTTDVVWIERKWYQKITTYTFELFEKSIQQ